MSEASSTHEPSKDIPEAIEEICSLYRGDLNGAIFGSDISDNRDRYWEEAAEEYPSLKAKIIELSKSLKDAYITKKANPETISTLVNFAFASLNDQEAKSLLSDLLLARIIESAGKIDYSINIANEVKSMLIELGGDKEIQGEDIKNITFNQVVEAALAGKLRLKQASLAVAEIK